MNARTIAHGCLLLCVASALDGCAVRTARQDSAGPSTPLATVYRTEVAMGSCVFRPRQEAFAAAIGSALLSSVVSQGVNYVSRALSEAAKETTDKATATRNIEVDQLTFGPCVQVVRGWFYRGFQNDDESRRVFSEATSTWASASDSNAIDPGKLTLFWQRQLWLAAQPDFVFEAEAVTFSGPATANSAVLALTPVYARLDHPIMMSSLRRSAARDVAVFFAFHEASASPDAPSPGSGGMVLGKLEPGQGVTFPPSVPRPEPNRGADESRWFSVSVGSAKKPMTVATAVTEHQDASAFLQFVADVFSDAKQPITTALQEAIVPAKREQAQETERTREETALNTYEDSLSKALTAAAACANNVTDPLGTASDVRSKVRTLNKNARAAGRGQVDENLVPLSTDSPRVKNGCVALRDRLQSSLA